MSFYHLPHPWDPGYAIPRYVMAEPPERGTFTTQWLPRGTIPTLIPDYLAKPGQKLLGRGDAGLGSLGGCTLAGNSLRGTSLSGTSLSGDTLAAQEYHLEPLGGGSTADYAAYGRKAARTMIAQAKRLPPQHRARAMKAAMARIDPTLQARAEKHAMIAKRSGMPASAALEHGIARAMTDGVLGELTKVGRSRRAPQPDSLLGLGCSRAQALGATFTPVQTLSSYPPPAGMTWDATLGALVFLAPGQKPVNCPGPCGVVRASQDSGPAQTTNTTQPAPPRATSVQHPMLQIGPTSMVMIPADDLTAKAYVRIHDPAQIPPEWKAFLRGAWSTSSGSNTLEQFDNSNPFAPFFAPWLAAVGLTIPFQANRGRMFSNAAGLCCNQSFVFKHPVDGSDWGLIARLGTGFRGSQPMPDANNPVVLWLEVAKVPEPNWFQRLVAIVVDVVGDIVDAVGDLTCDLVKTPGAMQGAAKANPAAAAGVAIVASQICSAPGGPVVPYAPRSSWLPLLLVGGLGIAVIAIARSRQ